MGNDLELEVWQRVAALAQSPSHDHIHIKRVQEFADALGRAIGVQTDLVRIAAILHDLGRGDETRRHGLASIEASSELAKRVLSSLRLSAEDTAAVLDAIESHDQPDLRPSSLAARILKDSDFMAGFGAWGVLRIAMWSGESGRSVEHAVKALTQGMLRRFASLEFEHSRVAAARELQFAGQFRAELERPAGVGGPDLAGFYCVIEGISGSGKNTLAEALATALERENLSNILVQEPGEIFRELRNTLSDDERNFTPTRKGLLLVDRASQFVKSVCPALTSGKVVLSVRSHLSTAVYQSADDAEAYRTLVEYDWVPPSDLLLLLDVDADDAHRRIVARQKAAGEFERPEQLVQARQRYLELSRVMPTRHLEIVDASQAPEQVAKVCVDRLIPLVLAKLRR